MAQCPNIIWEDHFEGTSLDLTKWNIQLGDGCDLGICGWGNNELQFYQAENIALNQGNLQIIAKKEAAGNKSYTSARLTTKEKGDWTYGRFEARMKLPTGKGIWPAFWMLSTPEPYGSWPQSGEIDIMELIGSEPATTHGTIHFGQLAPANRSVTASYTLQEGIFNDEFHTFALEWGVNLIRWYIDGFLHATQTNLATGGSRWPFDHDFHLLLNLAVGGNWPGSPNSATEFPQILEVDYVRVYDGFLPSLAGERLVENQAKSVRYQLFNLPPGAQVSWTVPERANIVSGQGESSILVDWNSIGGIVQANFTNGCQGDSLGVAVTVAPAFVRENTWENFDDPSKIVYNFSTGLLDDNATNPRPDDINSSPLCGKYVRNGAEQFDVLVYDVDQLDDAAPYLTGEKRFYLDVYTDAPGGTLVLLQLENNNRSQPTNYPIGRHSRYEARTKVQGAWQRLHLTLLDRPDPNTLNTSTDQVILLFGSNTNLGSTFFFDNLETYAPEQIVGALVPQEKLIKVYPNPADEYLILDLEPGSNIQDIKIYHLNGSLQEQITIDGDRSNRQVNISKLNKGVYLIRIINTDGSQKIARFVKI
ncbi:MAG: family 16 glycosylhydrolase [Saprospiraceae bacterium]|nr:family 16 glycosylhydrolase [Saprospiraceae bacterium]